MNKDDKFNWDEIENTLQNAFKQASEFTTNSYRTSDRIAAIQVQAQIADSLTRIRAQRLAEEGTNIAPRPLVSRRESNVPEPNVPKPLPPAQACRKGKFGSL